MQLSKKKKKFNKNTFFRLFTISKTNQSKTTKEQLKELKQFKFKEQLKQFKDFLKLVNII